MSNTTASTLDTTEPAPVLVPAQQPQWSAHPAYEPVRTALRDAAAMVTLADLDGLRQSLASVAMGNARLLQAGDCAESFYECTPERTDAKLTVLERVADCWELLGGLAVVRIGRIGGQFAKPRSSETERFKERDIPAFRGHLINSELPTLSARQHDPRRMLWAYEASARVLERLAERRKSHAPLAGFLERGPWSSHEALVLDYEMCMLREDPASGTAYLASTHLPWVGLRTHQPHLPHVQLLARVANPVGCKIGPETSPETTLQLCAALDPDRVPGRLVLIVRMGAGRIEEALPDLVAAVRKAGHPVVWLSDPMHGNTVLTPTGHKTRHLSQIEAEVRAFGRVIERAGMPAGGLHLEMAATDVTECVGGPVRSEADVPTRYLSLCDPRLNPEQAVRVLSAWN
jgi:3-deoxy-7-phosphoheptulonate synthase